MDTLFALLGITTLLCISFMFGHALAGPFLDALTDNYLDQITISGKLAGAFGCVICVGCMLGAVAIAQNLL